MRTNANQTCPKCGAHLDYVQFDSIVFECYSALYANTHQPMTISTRCLQRQIDQLTKELEAALEQLKSR